jgi:hypothetical protein
MRKLIFLICFLNFLNSNAQKYTNIKAEMTNLFEFVNVYDYSDSDNKIEISDTNTTINTETIIFQKIKGKINILSNKEIQSLVELMTKFKIIYNNQTHIFIKYKIKEAKDIKENIEVIDIIYDGAIYKENEIKDDVSIAVEKILKYANASILFEFYSSTDNSNFKDINSLKINVKDADGVLNIYKLAEELEKNKISLAKYLGE